MSEPEVLSPEEIAEVKAEWLRDDALENNYYQSKRDAHYAEVCRETVPNLLHTVEHLQRELKVSRQNYNEGWEKLRQITNTPKSHADSESGSVTVFGFAISLERKLVDLQRELDRELKAYAENASKPLRELADARQQIASLQKRLGQAESRWRWAADQLSPSMYIDHGSYALSQAAIAMRRVKSGGQEQALNEFVDAAIALSTPTGSATPEPLRVGKDEKWRMCTHAGVVSKEECPYCKEDDQNV